MGMWLVGVLLCLCLAGAVGALLFRGRPQAKWLASASASCLVVSLLLIGLDRSNRQTPELDFENGVDSADAAKMAAAEIAEARRQIETAKAEEAEAKRQTEIAKVEEAEARRQAQAAKVEEAEAKRRTETAKAERSRSETTGRGGPDGRSQSKTTN